MIIHEIKYNYAEQLKHLLKQFYITNKTISKERNHFSILLTLPFKII